VREQRRRRLLAWALAFAGLSLACAVSIPPPGGPEDRTPPSVAEVTPARDSAGVAADTRVRITFSEDMTQRGFERLVEFAPPVAIARVDWDDRAAVISLAEPLHPDTTYVVTLKAGYQDNHRVSSKEPFRFAFATSAAIDTGRVAGRVFFRREPSANALVYCYTPRDTAFVPGPARPQRSATVDEDGRYAIDYLSTARGRYILWAFQDQNKDGFFTADADVGYAGMDTVTLTEFEPSVAVDIAIVDPDEPALVSGRVVNATGIDTLAVSVALFALPDSLRSAGAADSLASDTTSAPSYYVLCDTTGYYELNSVRGGSYRLEAFVDIAADSLCGNYPCGRDSTEVCVEPCAIHPDTVVVAPGQVLEMSPIELGRAGDSQ
jgi:hypothetical protein